MKHKVPWLVLSSLIVLAILFSSCTQEDVTQQTTQVTGTSQTTTTTTTTTTTSSAPVTTTVAPTKEMTVDSLGRTVEKPQYGGFIKMVPGYIPVLFDDGLGIVYTGPAVYTGECLDEGNWAKGPTGANEISFRYNAMPPMSLLGGGLSSSWELQGTDTMVFHIRQNVYFQAKPPANGRQMDANDVVYSLNRDLDTPTAYVYNAIPRAVYIKSIKALDKWTVAVECQPGKYGVAYQRIAGMVRIIPKEVIDAYGKISDWKNLTGTGPWVLTDYVAQSSATFTRNPNYWQNDPLHPENKLPYLNGFSQIYITDNSTRLAAARTGKVDWLAGVNWEDANRLIKDVPEIKYVEYGASSAPAIFMRVDKTDQPFSNIKVRHALSMAIDRDSLVKDYYGGHAQKLMWPIMPDPAFSSIYIPFDKLPEATREILSYDPTKAKQLLADAGFPNGFTTEIICQQAEVEYLTLVKGYFEKINVTLNLSVKDAASWTSIGAAKSYNQMYYYGVDAAVDWDKFTRLATGMPLNYSMISDPILDKAALDMAALGVDAPKKMALFQPLITYLLDKSYMLALPVQNSYVMWQPRIKNYSGETMIGHIYTMFNFPKYVWADASVPVYSTK